MRTGNSNRWMFGKLLGLTLATLSLTAITHAATLKKIVAVSSFENKTTWRGQVDLGDGMADQLTDALMQSGQFTVMERQQLGAVVAEQDLANSGRAQKSQSTRSRNRRDPERAPPRSVASPGIRFRPQCSPAP